MRIAAIAARDNPTLPPIDELIDMARSRRRFIRDASFATAGLVLTGCSKPAPPPQQQQSGGTPAAAPAPSSPRGGARIAIVGAGMAGLNTAYKLQKAGLTAKNFEGADRTGGACSLPPTCSVMDSPRSWAASSSTPITKRCWR